MSKNYYSWTGQNATTGNQHPQTGLLSMFGDFQRFESRSVRDQYVREYYDMNGNKFAVAVNVKTAREYAAGMSVRDMVEHLENYTLEGYIDSETDKITFV